MFVFVYFLRDHVNATFFSSPDWLILPRLLSPTLSKIISLITVDVVVGVNNVVMVDADSVISRVILNKIHTKLKFFTFTSFPQPIVSYWVLQHTVWSAVAQHNTCSWLLWVTQSMENMCTYSLRTLSPCTTMAKTTNMRCLSSALASPPVLFYGIECVRKVWIKYKDYPSWIDTITLHVDKTRPVQKNC